MNVIIVTLSEKTVTGTLYKENVEIGQSVQNGGNSLVIHKTPQRVELLVSARILNHNISNRDLESFTCEFY